MLLTATPVRENQMIADLAAELTEPALAILTAASVRGDSVAMELELWRALTTGLDREASLRRMAGPSRAWQTDGAAATIIHRAVLEVAGAFGYWPEAAIRSLIARLRITERQRGMLSRLLAPTEGASLRPVGRSGLHRRLSLTVLN